jgi:hypothetical protein
MPSALVDCTDQDRAGRYQGWRPCACAVPIDLLRANQPTWWCQLPIQWTPIAYLRGALILKTCVILKTAIYVLLTCTDCSYNGQPSLPPFLSVFRSQIKTRQSTKDEQSGQGTLFIMATNKKAKVRYLIVKVSSLSAHSAGPLFGTFDF